MSKSGRKDQLFVQHNILWCFSLKYNVLTLYFYWSTQYLYLMTSTLKMKGVHSSQLLVPISMTTWHHNPGECNPISQNMLCNDESTAYIKILTQYFSGDTHKHHKFLLKCTVPDQDSGWAPIKTEVWHITIALMLSENVIKDAVTEQLVKRLKT